MSSAMFEPALPNGLPAISRFITCHNAQGQACFSARNAEVMSWEPIGPVSNFALGYTTSQFPVKFANEEDVFDYEAYLKDKPGITIPGGTVLRFVDMAPGKTSAMHRTISLDYGVVLEGEIELVLDSGETRLMKRGDVAIQRGTNHAWKNVGKGWSRMMYVLQDSESLTIAGNKPDEAPVGNVPHIRSSSPVGTH